MNITEEMISLADDLTTSICVRIDLLKRLLSEYEADSYILNEVLDLITPGHVQYDLDDEQFVFDYDSIDDFYKYLKNRKETRDNAINEINAKYGTLGPSDIVYTDTDSFKYAEAKENLSSIYGSCQKGVDNNDSI